MKKKIISILTCSTLLGLMPVSAFGQEINLMSMDFREATADSQGTGWDWDANSKTLTLTNFQGIVSEGVREESAAILLPEDSILLVEGNNNEITANSYRCSGIYSEGDLIIGGDGTLDINIASPKASGVYLNGGILSIEDDVDITVDAPTYAIYIYGLKSNQVAVSVLEDATFAFPDDLSDDAVYVIVKDNVDPNSITFNYKETRDISDELVTLSEVEVEEIPEVIPEVIPPQTTDDDDDIYTISIGNKVIQKNGANAYTSDVAPYINNGYTMLPLRALLTISDPSVQIKWDAPSKTATISYDDDTFVIKAGNTTMTEDGEVIALATPAEVLDGRLFVSLRDWMKIMDISNEDVSWNSTTKTVTLSD